MLAAAGTQGHKVTPCTQTHRHTETACAPTDTTVRRVRGSTIFQVCCLTPLRFLPNLRQCALYENMNPKVFIFISIVTYSLCSVALVLLDTRILRQLPSPFLLAGFQMFVTLLFLYTVKARNCLQVDPLRLKFVMPYLNYTIIFAFGLYLKALADHQTLLFFQSLAPCLVAYLDAVFMDRHYPKKITWVGLVLVTFGALGHVYSNFKAPMETIADDDLMNAPQRRRIDFLWSLLYFGAFSLEMVYGKHITTSVGVKTTSGRVYYTHMLGVVPVLTLAAVGNERLELQEDQNPPDGKLALFVCLACLAATGTAYSTWWMRNKVSATSFSLITVCNACLVSIMLHEQTQPLWGLAFLVGAALYRQAPPLYGKQNSHELSKLVAEEHDEVWDLDVTEYEYERYTEDASVHKRRTSPISPA
jgi:solute carrier family 35 protein